MCAVIVTVFFLFSFYANFFRSSFVSFAVRRPVNNIYEGVFYILYFAFVYTMCVYFFITKGTIYIV